MDAAALTLVVPLSNEGGSLPASVYEIAAFVAAQPAGSELLLVNDGSRDGTIEAAAGFLAGTPERPARLIPRAHRGRGAAVRAGLEEARSALAGFCDLDLATPLGDFARLVDAAREHRGIIVGSPEPAGSQTVRRASSVGETLDMARKAAGRLLLIDGVAASRCGARVAPTALWRRILPYCGEDGFTWEVEALAIARALEIPITRKGVSCELDADDSREDLLRDRLAMLRSLPRILSRARAARYGSASRTS